MGADTVEMAQARACALPANAWEWAEMEIGRGAWTREQWRMATERRAETAVDPEERARMERLVLKAWKGLETHAQMGRRGANTPANNMKEWTTDAGSVGGTWHRPHGRQVVFLGEAAAKGGEGTGLGAADTRRDTGSGGYEDHRKKRPSISSRGADMADQMQASGAARPPPYSLHVAPSARYTSSTATLGTSTARLKLLVRRAHAISDYDSPLAPTIQLASIFLLPCLLLSPRACAFAHPTHTPFPPPTRPPLSPWYVPLLPLFSSRRLRRSQLQPPPLLCAPGVYVRNSSSPPSSFLQHLPPSTRPLPSGSASRDHVVPHILHPGCPSFVMGWSLFSLSPPSVSRKAMSPDSPDACEGSCQNGLSSTRLKILPTYCFTAVLHMPSGCTHTVNHLYPIPTTLAPYFSAQWTRYQLQHRPRPSEVRAAEHRDPGRPARLEKNTTDRKLLAPTIVPGAHPRISHPIPSHH